MLSRTNLVCLQRSTTCPSTSPSPASVWHNAPPLLCRLLRRKPACGHLLCHWSGLQNKRPHYAPSGKRSQFKKGPAWLTQPLEDGDIPNLALDVAAETLLHIDYDSMEVRSMTLVWILAAPPLEISPVLAYKGVAGAGRHPPCWPAQMARVALVADAEHRYYRLIS